MKKHLFLIIKLFLAAAFLVSLIVAVKYFLEHRDGAGDYSDARRLAGIPDVIPAQEMRVEETNQAVNTQEETVDEDTEISEAEIIEKDPYMDALAQIDLAALQDINSDVIGWITIFGTEISYPLLHGQDNSYYLNQTWQKTTNSVGAIFLDAQNQRGLSDWNSIIYGHRINDGSMFGLLHMYEDSEYWKAHPSVYIALEDTVLRYDIFACYKTSAYLSDGSYEISFPDADSKQAYLDDSIERSVIDTGIVPAVNDEILTLSTCTASDTTMRWIVQAVLAQRQ